MNLCTFKKKPNKNKNVVIWCVAQSACHLRAIRQTLFVLASCNECAAHCRFFGNHTICVPCTTCDCLQTKYALCVRAYVHAWTDWSMENGTYFTACCATNRLTVGHSIYIEFKFSAWRNSPVKLFTSQDHSAISRHTRCDMHACQQIYCR